MNLVSDQEVDAANNGVININVSFNLNKSWFSLFNLERNTAKVADYTTCQQKHEFVDIAVCEINKLTYAGPHYHLKTHVRVDKC